ncbi:hypothetical protein B9Z55_010000 [Caenorhabditis nigoni]|uniref:Uncharacterized protein n=1 Tax=Caenorhabditis nigoni TaxID=1611254 RepID=A0A2G5UE20_9PELO|nr:hypothetical protein B9Z55_010000 [Caenorhabditis nigoni]
MSNCQKTPDVGHFAVEEDVFEVPTEASNGIHDNLESENVNPKKIIALDKRNIGGLAVLTSSDINKGESVTEGPVTNGGKVKQVRKRRTQLEMATAEMSELSFAEKSKKKKPRAPRKPRKKRTASTGSGIATKLRKARAPAKRVRKPKIVAPEEPKAPRKPRAPRRKSTNVDVLCKHFAKVRIDNAKIKKRPRKSTKEIVARLMTALQSIGQVMKQMGNNAQFNAREADSEIPKIPSNPVPFSFN